MKPEEFEAIQKKLQDQNSKPNIERFKGGYDSSNKRGVNNSGNKKAYRHQGK
jgi:hypothetical protein